MALQFLIVKFILIIFFGGKYTFVDGATPFYSACVRTSFEGWNNFGLLHPINRDVENLQEEPEEEDDSLLELPTELISNTSQLVETEWKNATTKYVLDQNAKNGVFKNPMEYLMIPKFTLKDRIRYLLFTKVSKNEYQVMPEDGTTTGTNWDPNRKIKVLLHGLTSTYQFSPIKNIWVQHIFEIKDAYLDPTNYMDGEFNVLVVDWTPLSTVPLMRYPDAASATRLAGEDVTDFLLKLHKNGNIPSFQDVHMLGHSLGAHVAGVVGQRLQEVSKDFKILRITGLDPAGPCFDTPNGLIEDHSRVLDRRDASFVDIIHTNMGNLISTGAGRYGSVMENGHVDFFPNGGETQVGCSFLDNRVNFCSHQKSVVFYAWSISKRFMGCPCTSWEDYGSVDCVCTIKSGGQYFGEHVDLTARGNFYLPL